MSGGVNLKMLRDEELDALLRHYVGMPVYNWDVDRIAEIANESKRRRDERLRSAA